MAGASWMPQERIQQLGVPQVQLVQWLERCQSCCGCEAAQLVCWVEVWGALPSLGSAVFFLGSSAQALDPISCIGTFIPHKRMLRQHLVNISSKPPPPPPPDDDPVFDREESLRLDDEIVNS